jgi:glucose-6-phosphate dehydrogenase assembly protein OpcA
MSTARAPITRVRGRTSANSARIPPSPRLSACSTKLTYLKDTTKLSDQNTSDITPMTFSRVGGMLWWPAKHSLSA